LKILLSLSSPRAAHFDLFPAAEKSGFILFIPEGDPAAQQIVRRQLHPYFVSWKDPDEVHADLSGNMGQDLMPILQLD